MRKNKKTLLTRADETKIIDTFCKKEAVDNFSVVMSYDDIKAKNYSLSASQFFEVKIDYVDISPEQFSKQLQEFSLKLDELSDQSSETELEIKKQLSLLNYE